MATTKKKSIFEDVLHLAGIQQPPVDQGQILNKNAAEKLYSNPIQTCPMKKPGLSPECFNYANLFDPPNNVLCGSNFFRPFLSYCSDQYRSALVHHTFLQYADLNSNKIHNLSMDNMQIAERYSMPILSPVFSAGIVEDKTTVTPEPAPKMCPKEGAQRITKKRDSSITDKFEFFKFASDFNNSVVNMKKPPPRFQCSECNRSYSTFSGLSKHKQFHCTSQMKKQFGCKYCDKKYSSLGAMKMHIRTHTLPCKCEICGKAFSRPWLLQGHTRTHTGQKPFSCASCGRAFADRSNLRAHLQTHSDVRKYRCKNCQKTFSRLSLLNKHEANASCSQQGRTKV